MKEKPNAGKIGWNLKRTTYLFESHWYNLRQDTISLPQEEKITYTYVEHPGAVFVVPLTRQGQLILIRSYRYPNDDYYWEVPSGTMGDRDAGLPQERLAREELLEEAGGRAAEMINLGEYFMANGFANYKMHIYLAKDVAIVKEPSTEITEKIINVQTFDFHKVLEMISSGTFNDGESAFAVLCAAAYLNKPVEN